MAEFALGLLLGLLASTAYLVNELQKLKDDRVDVLRRIIDAFHAGVAVNLAKEPQAASAELFRMLRQSSTANRIPVIVPEATPGPAKAPVPQPVYFEEGPTDFSFGGGASEEINIK